MEESLSNFMVCPKCKSFNIEFLDAIATLFGKSRATIAEHLQNVFNQGELERRQYVGNSDELPAA